MHAKISPVDLARLPDSISDIVADERSLARLLIAVRRHLHMHPEVGMEEHDTSAFIRQTLEGYGLDVKGPVAGTGLYVDVEGEGEGAEAGGHIGYRADIDALPAQDQKAVPYRSQTPRAAHLCGHDAHTSVAIGVALLLNEHRDELPGTVRIFFQPNEEGLPSGAPLMIRSGVLDGLESVYAIHVDPTLDVGKYGLITGPVTASSDRFDVHVHQEGTGHSARPHEGADTVWIANQIMQQFYQLAGRVTDARNASVLTVCTLKGSEAHNVIPEVASFGGTLRTISLEDRRTIRRHMRRTAEQLAELYGASVKLEIEDGAPPVINDGSLVKNVRETIREALGDQAIHHIEQSSMGGEDFAYYLQHIPGAFVRVGTASGPKTRHPLHHHQFNIDEAALAPTAHLMTRVLGNHLRHDITSEASRHISSFPTNGEGRTDPATG